MTRNPTWWVLMVAMAMVGCGGEDGDDECVESFIAIERHKVVPSPENTFALTPGGSFAFSVEGAVTHSCSSEELRYDWFLNYPTSCDAGICDGAYISGTGTPSTSLNQCAPVPRWFFRYSDEGIHLLELFISSEGVSRNPSTGERIIPKLYAYVSWWLETPEGCPD